MGGAGFDEAYICEALASLKSIDALTPTWIHARAVPVIYIIDLLVHGSLALTTSRVQTLEK